MTVRVLLSLLWFSLVIPGLAGRQGGATPNQAPAVRTQMRNVKYRFSDNVSVQINMLNGSLVPLGNSEGPVFDDKNSFKIHIDLAEIAIGTQDLANLLNSYVFARPNSPLSRVSVSITNGHLKIKGRLHDSGNLPFETQGVM